ncbi:MAG TPA: VTT domain-containing protein, partial [Geomonas sp.]|nr:VTT domain-containing protein [Geomonas sp.]
MKRQLIKVITVLLIVSAATGAAFFIHEDLFDLHRIREHRDQLLSFTGSHYFESVAAFIGLFFASALFLPGALSLSIAGGMLFGIWPAVLYVNLGATAGSLLAFVTARFLLGEWVQERFREPLRRFNQELSRHSSSYLLVLRIVPVAPFCVINYCAGITKIPLRTFAWTTSLGILPGSIIHAYVGY